MKFCKESVTQRTLQVRASSDHLRMHTRHYGWLGIAVLALIVQLRAIAAPLDFLSNQEAASGLRAALEKGANVAVASLGREDGFFGNELVRIPLPDSLARAERLMRRFGMGHYADELVLTLNRAAEAAVPEAKRLLIDSVRKMTIQDAKTILTAGETAGTDYFRRTTRDPLRERFLPIVQQATEKVGLAQTYNRYAEHGAALGLIPREHANLDAYVTEKALDGLYLMIAEEEKRIRANPVAAGTELLRRVFGALK
jgi:hypothetical protein